MAKILVVDDKPINRQLLKEILKYGHEILEAGDGAEALALTHAEHPDLVITDILMPTMDGYEFIRLLRSDSSIPNCPVIFYTAYYHEREARPLAEACGVTRIIYKPCEPQEVLDAVGEALGRPSSPTPQPQELEFSYEHQRLLTDKLAHKVEQLENEILERKRVEEALRESEERYRSLFENLFDAFCYCRMIFDEAGRPIDFIYLEANAAFETMSGFGDVVGKKVTEVIPGVREAHPEMLETYGRVAMTGRPEKFEIHFAPTGRWFDVSTYSSRKGFVAIIFDNITERKRAEKILQMAHDEQSRLVEERTRQLHEKEVMLNEIHHRVKNNLQVISSLVSLQADGSKDETVREVLRDVTFRVRSMALVHEKLYQSNDLAQIDFAEYVRSLLSYIWRSHGSVASSIRLTLALEPVLLSVDTAVPCGLILNELASNTLKHAFCGRSTGEVTVSLRCGEDGRIRLGVTDNGVGLPPGLDWRQARSLGLRLVQMLSRQIDAEVVVSGGEGAKFEMSFGLKAED